MRIKCL